MLITLTASAPRVNLHRRTLAGTVVRYGEIGSVGVVYDDGTKGSAQLSTRAGALSFPAALATVPLTLEHDEPHVIRGELALIDDNDERLYVALKAADGPLGDAALAEAIDRSDKGRGGLSFQLANVVLEGDEIVSADVVAIGQVHDPGFNSSRIDQIAASKTPAPQGTPTGGNMTPEQIARLAALRAQDSRTDAEQAELDQLAALEPAPEPAPAAPVAEPVAVAASVPAVPGGIPGPTAAARTKPRGSAYYSMLDALVPAIKTKNVAAISAALTDVIHTDHTENIEPFAWSGELWSGLQYVPEWSDLFTQGPLTNWEGKGWRFTTTPEMQDYAGDKTAIPSGTVVTEDSGYEAARMAVGVDVDRKFYDFGNVNQAFLDGLFQKIRESWEVKLDAKVRAYVLAQDVPGTKTLSVSTTNADATVTAATGSFSAADVGATISGTGIPAATTILSVTNSGSIELSANATATGTVTATIGAQEASLIKAAGRAALVLKRRRVGKASWVIVNDEDMFDLLDVTEDDLPAFLDIYGIKPEDFRSSPDVPRGTVLAGVRQAATVRTLPGSPIRVDAQNIANGGIDSGFFGYWAIEEHHTSGIVSVVYNPA